MSYFLVFVIVGFLIFVHELGHFAFGRLAGIPISRVSLGVGRALCSFRRGGTEYRVSMIPVGGYVLPELGDRGQGFLRAPVRARVLFTLGGPIANVVLAYALFCVESVISRGLTFDAAVVAPFYGVGYGLAMIVRALPTAFSSGSEVAGLVGVVAQGGNLINGDAVLALRFTIVMSLNLAILNMLPMPPLDGGKCVLYALEWLHEAAGRLHVPLNLAGLAVLLLFIAYTTMADLWRLLHAVMA